MYPTIYYILITSASRDIQTGGNVIWKSNVNFCRLWSSFHFTRKIFRAAGSSRGTSARILSYVSEGITTNIILVREEYNLPLTPEGYGHLLAKADGRIITKKRYVFPLEDNLKLELDIFEGDLAPLIIAEIEFPDEETARAYQPPKWLGEDVTYSPLYHNSVLSSPDTDIPSLNISRQQD